MPRWTRVSRAEDQALRNVSVFVGSLVPWLFLGCGIMYPLTSAGSDAARIWVAIAVVLAVGGIIQFFVWQLARQGVYVGESGIRFRTLTGSQVIPWRRVGRVLVVDNPRYRNRVVVIDTPNGDRIPTPICQFAPRFLTPPGPRPYVMVGRAELDSIAQTLDGLAGSRISSPTPPTAT